METASSLTLALLARDPLRLHEADWLRLACVSKTWREIVHALVLAQRTVLVTSETCAQHRIPARKERPERLRIVLDRCSRRFPRIQCLSEFASATPAQLARFHSELHVDAMTRLASKITRSMASLEQIQDEKRLAAENKTTPAAATKMSRGFNGHALTKESYYAQFEFIEIDEDTCMMRHTLEASKAAAGGVCHAVDQVMQRKENQPANAFCVVRPPGHHAEPQRAMGFCFFNNIGVAAFHALDTYALERIAIIDFDVHHGNGTQKRMESESRVLYVSLHQAPLFPHTGRPHETGEHNNILNIPLKARTSSREYRKLFLDLVRPRVASFEPQLILVSAGFDGHRHDPLADLCLDAADYYWITAQITRMAWTLCQGRVVSVLEGGYHATALGDSAEQHCMALVHNAHPIAHQLSR